MYLYLIVITEEKIGGSQNEKTKEVTVEKKSKGKEIKIVRVHIKHISDTTHITFHMEVLKKNPSHFFGNTMLY